MTYSKEQILECIPSMIEYFDELIEENPRNKDPYSAKVLLNACAQYIDTLAPIDQAPNEPEFSYKYDPDYACIEHFVDGELLDTWCCDEDPEASAAEFKKIYMAGFNRGMVADQPDNNKPLQSNEDIEEAIQTLVAIINMVDLESYHEEMIVHVMNVLESAKVDNTQECWRDIEKDEDPEIGDRYYLASSNEKLFIDQDIIDALGKNVNT